MTNRQLFFAKWTNKSRCDFCFSPAIGTDPSWWYMEAQVCNKRKEPPNTGDGTLLSHRRSPAVEARVAEGTVFAVAGLAHPASTALHLVVEELGLGTDMTVGDLSTRHHEAAHLDHDGVEATSHGIGDGTLLLDIREGCFHDDGCVGFGDELKGLELGGDDVDL